VASLGLALLASSLTEIRWHENTCMALKWYPLRRGREYKLANVDPQGVLHLKDKENWELLTPPCDTREEAQQVLDRIKEQDKLLREARGY
jgi:hypothetical protein